MARYLLPMFVTAALVSGCGESGAEEKGPHKAMLLLRTDDGRLREFDLGDYRSLEACFGVLAYEASSAAPLGDEFWTNADFSYGGVRQDGWDRNTIEGGGCRKN